MRILLSPTPEPAINSVHDHVLVTSVHDACVMALSGYMYDYRLEYVMFPIESMGENVPSAESFATWLAKMDQKHQGFLAPRFAFEFHGRKTNAVCRAIIATLGPYLMHRKNDRYKRFGSPWKEAP